MTFLISATLLGMFSIAAIVYGKGNVFTRVRAYLRNKYVRFVASTIRPELSNLAKKSHNKGEKAGYERGLAEGKNTWELLDSRTTPEERELDDSVYGPDLFNVTDEIRDQMKREVAAAVSAGLISEPTNQQWEMILSNHPSTCVLAGAGSGKSTTLVLRIVFMLAHLGVKMDELTVVSFTNDSCNDLREKLVKQAPHWNLPIDEGAAKEIVRTFHSALCRMGKAVLPGVIWFENIGRNNKNPDDPENPFASSINDDQVELLRPSYFELFEHDEVFRKAVLGMLEIETARELMTEDSTESYDKKELVIKRAGARDFELVKLLNERWAKKNLWPIDGIDPVPFEVFNKHGVSFYANGKIISSGTPVFLGTGSKKDDLFADGENVGQGDSAFTVTGSVGLKRKIMNWHFGKPSIFVVSSNALNSLSLRVKYLESQPPTKEAPMLEVRLNGEKGPSKLLEAFISQASFIESMGLEVTDFVRRMRPFKERDVDHHFCTALGRFWPHFERGLSKSKTMTFNRGFRILSKTPSDLSERSSFTLHCKPFTHLLIDEFQDISSQIVLMIKNAQRLLAIANKRPSIMAIGDDWQSIYGWRGSSPEFFIHFDRHFKVHDELGNKSNMCPMGENFRSIPEIVDDGNKVLAPVKIKTSKGVYSKMPKDEGDHGVKVIPQGKNDNNAYMKHIVAAVNQQYNEMSARPKGDKTKVLVIGRTNASIKTIEGQVGSKKGMLFRTIHRSKGLQAEAAIICEDCISEGPHPIRDRVYGLMKDFKCKSYEEAQSDEALRLAYVAVTRGIRRVYWFSGKGDGAAKTLVDPVAPGR